MNRIHIVEDEQTLANEVCLYLEGLGYDVICSETINQARKNLSVTPCDLIILDVNLPDGTGFDFCREIREKSLTPILMLTALGNDEDVIQGLKSGADDYVSKPCSLRVLSMRIQTLLRRNNWKDEDRSCLISGNLRIDPFHKTVFNGEIDLNLGKTEFEIVHVLIREYGRILPRDTLFDRIWDSKENFVEDNTLSVHVSRLRNKLGKYNDVSYIETVKGIGYRWNVEVKKSSLL